MTDQPMHHLFDMTADQLTQLLAELDQGRYRARQVLEWVYRHGAGDFEQMTNLSKALRADLARLLTIYASRIVNRQLSADGTVKLLLEFGENVLVETVMIPEKDRRTVCVSTQVGCPVGCRFCASGVGGFAGNLTSGQIVEQVMQVQRMLRQDPAAGKEKADHVTHVVFMGMGEPLLNYQQTIRAIRTLNADWGLNIGARKITVSTVGIVEPIRRLAREGLQINLAISLHAPNDELRQKLIPWAKRYPIHQIIDAAEAYFKRTGREVTLEYLLLDQFNCRLTHAQQLARIAKRLRANVNLILYNRTDGDYQPPPVRNARHFLKRLRQLAVNAHLRTSRGADIDAACGQLRRRSVAETPPGPDG